VIGVLGPQELHSNLSPITMPDDPGIDISTGKLSMVDVLEHRLRPT